MITTTPVNSRAVLRIYSNIMSELSKREDVLVPLLDCPGYGVLLTTNHIGFIAIPARSNGSTMEDSGVIPMSRHCGKYVECADKTLPTQEDFDALDQVASRVRLCAKNAD